MGQKDARKSALICKTSNPELYSSTKTKIQWIVLGLKHVPQPRLVGNLGPKALQCGVFKGFRSSCRIVNLWATTAEKNFELIIFNFNYE